MLKRGLEDPTVQSATSAIGIGVSVDLGVGVSISICVYVIMCVCMYVCMYVGMYVCMYVYIYIYTPAKTSTHKHASICVYSKRHTEPF